MGYMRARVQSKWTGEVFQQVKVFLPMLTA